MSRSCADRRWKPSAQPRAWPQPAGVSLRRKHIAEGSLIAVPRTLAAPILTASFIATACPASGGSPGGSPSAAGQDLPSGAAGAVGIGTASSRSFGTFPTGPTA